MSDSIADEKDNGVAVTKMLDPSGPVESLSPTQKQSSKAEASTPPPKVKTDSSIQKDIEAKAESHVVKEMTPAPRTESKTSSEVKTKTESSTKPATASPKAATKSPAQSALKREAESKNGKALDAPKLSNYIDFRIYLADFLKFKRSQKLGIRKYSPSDFAAAADLKSPQYLKLVIDRQRNLSEDGVQKFAKALGLNKEESTEFLYLVFYNQATKPKERYNYLQKLSEHRAKSVEGIKTPHWLKVILYSICEGMGGEYTVDDFKALLGDKCKMNELQDCLDELVKDKAIIQSTSSQDQTVYSKSQGQNTLSNDIPIDVIKKIQSDLLLLALESLFSDSPKDRDLGSFSMALTAKEFEETKFEIRKFRKNLLKDLLMKREQSPGDRVYQVQFQIFPVTNTVDKKRD